MPTTPAQKDQITAQLEQLYEIKTRPMMGEYLVYANGIYFANVCDGSLLIKITPTNEHYDLPKVLPYASAKRQMFRIDQLGGLDSLRELIDATLKGLKKPTKN